MPMIETADFVAEKYNITREYQDEYSLQSQQRTVAAQEGNKFDDEIISTTTTKSVKNKETGEVTDEEVELTKDEEIDRNKFRGFILFLSLWRRKVHYSW